jgi:hypothetical protein
MGHHGALFPPPNSHFGNAEKGGSLTRKKAYMKLAIRYSCGLPSGVYHMECHLTAGLKIKRSNTAPTAINGNTTTVSAFP